MQAVLFVEHRANLAQTYCINVHHLRMQQNGYQHQTTIHHLLSKQKIKVKTISYEIV